MCLFTVLCFLWFWTTMFYREEAFLDNTLNVYQSDYCAFCLNKMAVFDRNSTIVGPKPYPNPWIRHEDRLNPQFLVPQNFDLPRGERTGFVFEGVELQNAS